MTTYLNTNGNSNVAKYEIGTTYINVKFYGTVKVYRYSYSSAGQEKVETMKNLAHQGHGLNSFINTHAKFLYEK